MNRPARFLLLLIVVVACAGSIAYIMLVQTDSAGTQEPVGDNGASSDAVDPARRAVVDASRGDRGEVIALDGTLDSVRDQVARDLDDAASFQIDQRSPERFVRRAEHEITPALTRHLLTAEALPRLYELLSDPAYAEDWPAVARTICLLSDDPGSVPVVLAYVRRADNWRSLSPGDHSARCLGKIDSIRWVGLIDRDAAAPTLHAALSTDGARELISNWVDGPLPPWASSPIEDVIGVVQGAAAIGIAQTPDAEGMRLVRKAYESARANADEQPFVSARQMRLVEAMAISELIDRVGVEDYRLLLGTVDYDHAIGPILEKYRWW